MFLHRGYGAATVPAFRDHVNLRVAFEEVAQAFPGERFVFDYDRADLHSFGRLLYAGTAGMTTVAATPLAAVLSRVNR